LAKFAGVVTQQEIEDYVNKVLGFKDLTLIRKIYKAANYACIYGVGAAKLARELKISLKQAKDLIKTYWKRNWSVKKLSDDLTVKKVDGEMWLFNPVSRFWYSLRNDKDRFSTLNQSTGVYCFDKWIMNIVSKRPQLTAQFHDEIVLEIKEKAEKLCENLLTEAIDKVNEELNLNITLSVDIQFGKTYAEIH
jgi:DNA polymerase I-like protein with 3'-5' exonuclease and polymerase domains